jgi:hypothetical protein
MLKCQGSQCCEGQGSQCSCKDPFQKCSKKTKIILFSFFIFINAMSTVFFTTVLIESAQWYQYTELVVKDPSATRDISAKIFNRNISMRSWMFDLRDQIGSRIIDDILFIGTHNSASYVIDYSITNPWYYPLSFPLIRAAKPLQKFISTWTITQDHSIFQQLESGARALHLSVTEIDDKFYVQHSYMNSLLEDSLKELTNFLDINDKEIVKLYIQRRLVKNVNLLGLIIGKTLEKYNPISDIFSGMSTYDSMIVMPSRIMFMSGVTWYDSRSVSEILEKKSRHMFVTLTPNSDTVYYSRLRNSLYDLAMTLNSVYDETTSKSTLFFDFVNANLVTKMLSLYFNETISLINNDNSLITSSQSILSISDSIIISVFVSIALNGIICLVVYYCYFIRELQIFSFVRFR